jgi:hypothetical protein
MSADEKNKAVINLINLTQSSQEIFQLSRIPNESRNHKLHFLHHIFKEFRALTSSLNDDKHNHSQKSSTEASELSKCENGTLNR